MHELALTRNQGRRPALRALQAAFAVWALLLLALHPAAPSAAALTWAELAAVHSTGGRRAAAPGRHCAAPAAEGRRRALAEASGRPVALQRHHSGSFQCALLEEAGSLPWRLA